MDDTTHKQNKGRQRQLTTTYGRLNFITDIGFVCSTCMHVSVCTVIKITHLNTESLSLHTVNAQTDTRAHRITLR